MNQSADKNQRRLSWYFIYLFIYQVSVPFIWFHNITFNIYSSQLAQPLHKSIKETIEDKDFMLLNSVTNKW